MTPARRTTAPLGESGMALLSALLAVALLTVIVVEFADTSLLHAHLSRNAGNAIAAQMLARSAVTGVEDLMDDSEIKPETLDAFLQPNQWMPVPGIPGATVVVLRSDEGGKLDLNSVNAKLQQKQALKALFSSLGLDESLVDRVSAWIKPADKSAGGQSARDLCAIPNCVPRGENMRDMNELHLIAGFDDKVIGDLQRHVTVIPGKGTTFGVNVRTATPEVLSAIQCEKPSFPPADSKDNDLSKICPNALPGMALTSSTIYSIIARANVGDATQEVAAMVKPSKGGTATRLTWHERPVSGLTPAEVP